MVIIYHFLLRRTIHHLFPLKHLSDAQPECFVLSLLLDGFACAPELALNALDHDVVDVLADVRKALLLQLVYLRSSAIDDDNRIFNVVHYGRRLQRMVVPTRMLTLHDSKTLDNLLDAQFDVLQLRILARPQLGPQQLPFIADFKGTFARHDIIVRIVDFKVDYDEARQVRLFHRFR